MDISSSENSSLEVFTEPRFLLAEKQLASIPLWEPKKKSGKGQQITEKVVS